MSLLTRYPQPVSLHKAQTLDCLQCFDIVGRVGHTRLRGVEKYYRLQFLTINYLRQTGYVFVVVCLSVCLLATLHKTFHKDFHEFWGKVGSGLMNKWLNFGGDPDHCLDTGIVFQSSLLGDTKSGINRLHYSVRYALAGITIVTITSLRHRRLAEVCTVPQCF